MKVLYIVPQINTAGGVARVLSIKTNYLIKRSNYEVHILAQNTDSPNPFYDFNPRIIHHNMLLKGNLISYFNTYKREIKKCVLNINPDVVVVCDNGLKAFIVPFIIKDRPVVLEVHGSRFIEEKAIKKNLFSKLVLSLKYDFKISAARKFTKIVVLSVESLKEWHTANAVIIPNLSWIESEKVAPVKNKRVIAVARNSYEKGLDRLLLIWKSVNVKHPKWQLDIYTDEVENLTKNVSKLELDTSVNCYSYVKNIEDKYLESSVFVMTSRTEGFPMVLIEAMSLGLPCIAFDCPVGPRALIEDNRNGFIVADNDILNYGDQLSVLMKDESLRRKFGTNAKITSKKYKLKQVMEAWDLFFEKITKV